MRRSVGLDDCRCKGSLDSICLAIIIESSPPRNALPRTPRVRAVVLRRSSTTSGHYPPEDSVGYLRTRMAHSRWRWSTRRSNPAA